MLKNAQYQGYVDALTAFGLEKYAAAAPTFEASPVNPNLGVLQRTRGHIGNLGRGLKGWLGTGPQQPATTARGRAGTGGIRSQIGQEQAISRALAKKQVMTSGKALLPAAALTVGGLWGAKKLFGKSKDEKRREAQGLG